VQDRDQLRDRDIYGYELMSDEERREYRNRMQRTTTDQEWARFRAEHQSRMLARSRERGVALPPPFYGQQLMTDAERERLRERLMSAATEQERERIRAAHREEMQQRARARQIPLGELDQ
jgi:RimJ/RimL family protein N-acetyltransferase